MACKILVKPTVNKLISGESHCANDSVLRGKEAIFFSAYPELTLVINSPPTEANRVTVQLQIITLYCACDDFLKTQKDTDSSHSQMTCAEVMTTALVAATFFHGHQYHAQRFLQKHGYMPQMLSSSRQRERTAVLTVAYIGFPLLTGAGF